MTDLATALDPTGEHGFCPFCHQREGPFRHGPLPFWFCTPHRVHSIGPCYDTMNDPRGTPEEEAEVDRRERQSAVINPSRAWRPPEIMAKFRQRMKPAAFEKLFGRHREREPMFNTWPTADDD